MTRSESSCFKPTPHASVCFEANPLPTVSSGADGWRQCLKAEPPELPFAWLLVREPSSKQTVRRRGCVGKASIPCCHCNLVGSRSASAEKAASVTGLWAARSSVAGRAALFLVFAPSMRKKTVPGRSLSGHSPPAAEQPSGVVAAASSVQGGSLEGRLARAPDVRKLSFHTGLCFLLAFLVRCSILQPLVETKMSLKRGWIRLSSPLLDFLCRAVAAVARAAVVAAAAQTKPAEPALIRNSLLDQFVEGNGNSHAWGAGSFPQGVQL